MNEGCACYCHVNVGASCNVDSGYGVGCGPHADDVALEDACVLGHPANTERFVGMVCKRHYHWIDRTLNEIVELYALLPDVLLLGPGGDERSATRVGSPAPGRLEVIALMTAPGQAYRADDPESIPNVPWVLDTYVRMVLEDLPPSDTREIPTGDVVSLTRFLRRWRHFIARQEWVDGYADEIASLHRAVARAVGDSMWPKPVGRCPGCGRQLFVTTTLDEIHCRKCRETYGAADLLPTWANGGPEGRVHSTVSKESA